MAEDDRRRPPWLQIVAAAALAAPGGSWVTVEWVNRSIATLDERVAQHIRYADETRATFTTRVARLEDEVRVLRDSVIRCEVREKCRPAGR
jgi:hypothetical protein